MPRTLGEIIPLGAGNPDCGSDIPENELRLRIQEDCGKSGSAAGRLTVCTDIADARKGIELTAKVVDIIAGVTMSQAQSELRRDVGDGTRQMNEGAAQMAESGDAYNNSTADWLRDSSAFNSLAPQLSAIQSTLAQNKTVIDGLQSRVDQGKAQLPQAERAIQDAQARSDYARNRANYPRTLQGLQQQRADAQAAATAMRDASLNKAALENQIRNDSVSYNEAVASNNATLAQGQALAEQASQAKAGADDARARAQQAEAGVRAGQQQYRNGVQTIKKGMRDFNDVRDNQVTPMVEGANGLRGVSKIMDKVDQERGYSAVAEGMNAGYGIGARLSKSAPLMALTDVTAKGINAAGDALDRLDQGATPGEAFEGFVTDFGQATVRSSDMARIAEQVELADCVASNDSNPNAAYDAMTILNSQFGPAVDVAGGIAETASPFIPGLNAASPVIPLLTGVAGTMGQGLLQAATETGNKLWNEGLSAEVGNYPPRDLGPGSRNLVQREQGGPASAGTVMIAGVAVTIGEASSSGVNRMIGNNANNAARAQSIVQDIARTGAPGVPPPAPLRAGEITLRPPAATPVTPPVFVGD